MSRITAPRVREEVTVPGPVIVLPKRSGGFIRVRPIACDGIGKLCRNSPAVSFIRLQGPTPHQKSLGVPIQQGVRDKVDRVTHCDTVRAVRNRR